MTKVELIRFCHCKYGTFGRMMINGEFFYTVERPWLDNRISESCIPTGTYTCKPRFYHRGGYDAVEICEVPDRTHILFHRANLSYEVEGCIGVGLDLGAIRGQWAVLSSKRAFSHFMDHVKDWVFQLDVKNLDV